MRRASGTASSVAVITSLLSGRESQSGAHRDFGQAIEILFKFRCRGKLPFGKCIGSGHGYDYHAGEAR